MTYFGWVDGSFVMLAEDQIEYSILGRFGNLISWLFAPQGWGNWQAAVASITGLVAKENIVGTLGILYSTGDASVYQNISAAFTEHGCRLFFPGIQPAVRSLLRGNGCDQA